jgi:hypothetical protein
MTFTIVQNDTVPPISSQLSDSGSPVDLSNADKVSFHMEDKYDRKIIEEDNKGGRVYIVDESSGEVEYLWQSGDTEKIGSYKAQWQVEYNNGKVETFPSRGKIDIEVTEEIA